jgi:hypothetical protein
MAAVLAVRKKELLETLTVKEHDSAIYVDMRCLFAYHFEILI